MKILMLMAAVSAMLAPPPSHASSVEGLVPTGWAVEARADGDLNGDGLADTVLVLKAASDTRILVVVFARPHGEYDLVALNNKLLPADRSDGERSFDKSGLTIRSRVIRLRVDRLRGNLNYDFREQGNRFELIGYTARGVTAGEFEDDSYNFSTNRMRQLAGAIDKDGGKTSWFVLTSHPLPMLEKIGPDWFPPSDYVPAK